MLSCQTCGGSPKLRVGGAAGHKSMALTELGQMETLGKKRYQAILNCDTPKHWWALPAATSALPLLPHVPNSVFLAVGQVLTSCACWRAVELQCLLGTSLWAYYLKHISGNWLASFVHMDNTHESVVGVTLPPCKRFYQKSFKSVLRVKKNLNKNKPSTFRPEGMELAGADN